MKTRSLLVLAPVVALAAGCGGQAASRSQSGHPANNAARLVSVASGATASRCTVSQLALRLGRAGGAAGSTYQPIVFTNKGSSACTLTGYPGVAYVAPRSGAQVGAAATRDPAEAPRTVTLAAGGHAASLLQMVQSVNYPASTCSAKTVSGLRVYPPGSKSAVYLAFAQTRKACSSKVQQLTVRAVVKGRTGQ